MALAACLLAVLLLLGAPTAHADEAAPTPTRSRTSEAAVEDASGNILDTQNLLGNDFTKVADAITATKDETGVTVRLVYVDSFNTDEQPDAWAQSTLKSLDPAPNTVMLAVAANDGNLAVVVSPNSDEWLRSQSTVDDLSEAASAPLADAGSDGPDWAASALDMMAAIRTAKNTSTSRSAASVGTVVMVSALVVLVVAVGVVIVVRRRRETKDDAERVVEAQDEAARGDRPADGSAGEDPSRS